MAPRISYEEVLTARRFLSQYLQPTRLQPAPSVSRSIGTTVTLKLETDLPTGTFKIRGALWALAHKLQEQQISRVVTASTGNHGAAVAFAASLLKVPCTIYLPKSPNVTKRKRIRELGAAIVESGTNLTEAADNGREYAASCDAYFLDDTTDPNLPAGPATIALEVLEQQPETDMIVVPVGDTALIRGIGTALHHLGKHVTLVGVQSVNVPGYYAAWRAGKFVVSDSRQTIADGLASQRAVASNIREIRELVDDFVIVSDPELSDAMRYLILEERVLSEPAGAAAVAALLNRKCSTVGRFTCAIVSGANVAPEALASIVADELPAL